MRKTMSTSSSLMKNLTKKISNMKMIVGNRYKLWTGDSSYVVSDSSKIYPILFSIGCLHLTRSGYNSEDL